MPTASCCRILKPTWRHAVYKSWSGLEVAAIRARCMDADDGRNSCPCGELNPCRLDHSGQFPCAPRYRGTVSLGGNLSRLELQSYKVWKVRGLTLLLRVVTSWRCGDGLYFEVPPLASYALLTVLHPLLENVLQTVDHFEISCLGAPFSWLEKPRNRMGRDLDCMADVLMGFHGSTFSKPNTVQFRSRPMRFLGFSNHENRAPRQEISKWSTVCNTFSRSGWSVVRSAWLAKGGISKKIQSPHLHKVPTRSNKVSPRSLQTALVCLYPLRFKIPVPVWNLIMGWHSPRRCKCEHDGDDTDTLRHVRPWAPQGSLSALCERSGFIHIVKWTGE
jgi:hypothetical protein